ncbi:MAG: hypothetical protein Kow00109_10980 [Acidobacteriota bacterium]
MSIMRGSFWLALFGVSLNWGVGAPLPQHSAGNPETPSPVYLQEAATPARRAVFAQFLAVLPNAENPAMGVDCALSISNVCAAPEGLEPFLLTQPNSPTSGKIWIFLYNADGTPTVYVTGPDHRVGAGLDAQGRLGPGETWTVRLAEILADAWNVPESEVTFRGYGWVLSEFDCLAGTYNNTIFGLGFTQNFEMVPAMGQGGWFGGVPVPQE